MFYQSEKTFDPNEIVLDPNEILFDENEIDPNEIDPNEIEIYLNETEFNALLIGNLIYVYVKENSEIQFSTNEVTFQLVLSR